MRDDFLQKVIDTLAKRVGHRCSNPDCRVQTSGPHSDPNRAVNLGEAAHITAASPGGPRYDPSLTSSERSSIENGIWLCQRHAKLIDNDVCAFPVERIRQWKEVSEELIRRSNLAGNSEGEVLEEPRTVFESLNLSEMHIGFPVPSDAHVFTASSKQKTGDQVELHETPQLVPTSEQIGVLVKALERFVWHDSSSYNPIPRLQERLRMPGFIDLADLIRPFRMELSYVGWPIWFPELLSGIVKIFDTIAYTWGWEKLLESADIRDSYLNRCEDNFREKYLIPIQAAARLCRKNYDVIDRPLWLEEIIEITPLADFDLNIVGRTDPRLGPLLEPLHEKRNALMYGINYPTIQDYDGDDESDEFKAETLLGKRLGQATQKLSQAVKSARKF